MYLSEREGLGVGHARHLEAVDAQPLERRRGQPAYRGRQRSKASLSDPNNWQQMCILRLFTFGCSAVSPIITPLPKDNSVYHLWSSPLGGS